MFAYSNGGFTMRAVANNHQPEAGEVIFSDYATGAELEAAFPGYAAAKVRAETLAAIVPAAQSALDKSSVTRPIGAAKATMERACSSGRISSVWPPS